MADSPIPHASASAGLTHASILQNRLHAIGEARLLLASNVSHDSLNSCDRRASLSSAFYVFRRDVRLHPAYQWGRELNDGWMIDKLQGCRQLMDRHGDRHKEIWITEIG